LTWLHGACGRHLAGAHGRTACQLSSPHRWAPLPSSEGTGVQLSRCTTRPTHTYRRWAPCHPGRTHSTNTTHNTSTTHDSPLHCLLTCTHARHRNAMQPQPGLAHQSRPQAGLPQQHRHEMHAVQVSLSGPLQLQRYVELRAVSEMVNLKLLSLLLATRRQRWVGGWVAGWVWWTLGGGWSVDDCI
jgi:hypothetical protein